MSYAPRIGRIDSDRLTYSCLALGASAILVTARLLEPSPSGVGTHQQLGLPPCVFLKLTGLPCPSCGLTTSFAHAARFEFGAALSTQPFGFLLFVAICLSIPLAGYLIYRRIPISRWMYGRWSNPALFVFVALYMFGWFYKLWI
ncbi:MAG: DUF2752 domain-containing protein [Acidobacteriota bacterium]